ncbi:MAG: hypothetical protein QGD90_07650 [Candidatus Hydrogenedentes bacterium]|nr:hypothetical protein [Candidatus Hydrogenedentota bacterium]
MRVQWSKVECSQDPWLRAEESSGQSIENERALEALMAQVNERSYLI